MTKQEGFVITGHTALLVAFICSCVEERADKRSALILVVTQHGKFKDIVANTYLTFTLPLLFTEILANNMGVSNQNHTT